jgi:two-component system nitrate/nitrite response regulator NarL
MNSATISISSASVSRIHGTLEAFTSEPLRYIITQGERRRSDCSGCQWQAGAGGSTGLERITVRDRSKTTRQRVVLLLDTDERELVVEAFLNNARGIFCRIGLSEELRKCIQSVQNGQIWVNNSQLEYIVEALMQAPARYVTSGRATTLLSKREEEIARLVAAGLPNRDVSDKLGLSQHTVKNNLYRIFGKLGISTRIELVLYVLSQAKPSETQNDLGSHVFYQISA